MYLIRSVLVQPWLLELRLNPIDRGAIARGALAPVAELAQSFDRRFVGFEIESPNQIPNRIFDRRLRLRLRRERGQKPEGSSGKTKRQHSRRPRNLKAIHG